MRPRSWRRSDSRSSADGVFLVVLVAVCLAVYWPGFRVFFSLDDLTFLMRASGLERSAASHGRILSTMLFFVAGWKFFGTQPWPYHLVVFLLHVANAWLLYLLARRLQLVRLAAYAASILFATAQAAFLPLHWISGIQEVSMTFFALAAAHFFIGKSAVSAVLSLAAGCLSMLCKETTVLLFPALALVLPVSKRRKWFLGVAGLLLGMAILGLSGNLGSRPRGDPYESAFGVNLLWNFLTYSAWLIRFWVPYPDGDARYHPELAMWGLVLPILVSLAAWLLPKIRGAVGKAALVFILLLLPVLPLVRHSYFYYMYLPLVPVWMIAGAALARVPRRTIPVLVLALFVVLSGWNAERHRRTEMSPGVLEDPVLRYAQVARNVVLSMRKSATFVRGDIVVTFPSRAVRIDLMRGQKPAPGTKRAQISGAQRALLGGKALRLFFPLLQKVHFEGSSPATTGWENMNLFITHGHGEMVFLGQGEQGRHELIKAGMNRKAPDYDLAKREVLILLENHPDDPLLVSTLAEIAVIQEDTESLGEIIQRLERIESKGDASGIARRTLNILRHAAVGPTLGKE